MGISMNAPLQTSSLFRPATRLSSIGVSEILKITGLATDLKRQGKDVIILGAGNPISTLPLTSRTQQLAQCMQARRNTPLSTEHLISNPLSAKLYCCADQIGIVRSHNTIWKVDSVLKANPGREIEASSLANAWPNAAGFSMQEDRQIAVRFIKYREDLMSFSQRLFAIAAGHFHQNSQAFLEIYLGNKSLCVLAVPKPCFNAYAAGNQEANYLGCVRFTQVN
jgi:hypothetical protein